MSGNMTRNSYIRLIALPISKQSHKPLIYFYAQLLPSIQPDNIPTPQETPPLSLSPPILIKKATDLGSKQWNKLALSKKNSWKFKIYTMGERLMDKIPFEEWALKSIDPGTLPKPIDLLKTGSSTESMNKIQKIELLYPGSLFQERELMEGFQSSMAKSQPYHRKWMKLNVLLSPLTLPVGIVPLIPNLPFFYMMWRAWSHWRAYNASRYLNQMIESGYVRSIPSEILDSLYAKNDKENERQDKKGVKNVESIQIEESEEKIKENSDDDVILSNEMLIKLQEKLSLPIESAIEISRGIQQAKLRLKDSSYN